MKTHPKLTAILFFLLCHITIASSAPLYMAVDNIALSCGTSGNTKATDQREWIGDLDLDAKPPKILSPTRQPVYLISHSHTCFRSPLARNSFACTFIPLHTQTFVKEFCINFEKNQKLNLTFIPFSSNYYAFINGIEIISMPIEYMYYSPQDFTKDELVPKYVGQAPQFFINYSMALEMVYRLNVGGNSISPMEDTGMFREWSDGINYLLSGGSNPSDSSVILKYSKIPNYTALDTVYHAAISMLSGGSNPSDSSVILKYSKIPNYTAPDTVYHAAISMGPNSAMNKVSYLTWESPVDTGFDYLVRLHFCEIDPIINLVSSRVFIVYIDYQIAEERADVISWADNKYTPIFKDYVVKIQNSKDSEKKHILSIDLHPISDPGIIYWDAILNDVEMFKLSDSDGNLVEPSMAPPLLDQ
ncbi:receptor-like protein kinase FERONIA isoform X1 [Fagus crenata]